tara:strand:+ start:1220 stop:2701 length:1482 start_codon:yes stop_codon:yes gene_type:complete
MKIIVFISLFITSIFSDIGHYNFTFEGKVFNNTIRALVKPPGVVPGVAMITINTFDQSIDSIKIQPIKWQAEIRSYPYLKAGPQGAPPSEMMNKLEDLGNFFEGELWLMDFGAYNINVELFQNNSVEIINIPINSIATEIKPMSFKTSFILFCFMLLLLFGATNIITIAFRESTIDYNKTISSKKIKESRFIMLASFCFLLFILYFGNEWWIYTEKSYRENLYVPMDNKVEIINNNQQNILQVFFTDELWLNGMIPNLMPDHGKIMHLYLIHEDHSQLCHLHPQRNPYNNNLFEVVLPNIKYGIYYLYMDITLESGFSTTLTNQINFNPNNIKNTKYNHLISDKDDSYISQFPKYQLKWINKKNTFYRNEDINLSFQTQTIDGNPSRIEPYIQMGGHGAILKNDHSIFIHIHPIGTISMASQELYNKNYEIESSGICYFGDTVDSITSYFEDQNSFVTFPPINLDKLGEYTMWIQAKSGGEIITQQFDFKIIK